MQETKEEAKMKMIDVSEFQGKIDFKKVKADGIEGVIIRAGYGKGNADEYFVRNINGAIKAGLHIGIYWFSYAYDVEMAKREAQFCNDFIQSYKLNIDMPVFFDWEYDSNDYAIQNGVTPDKKLVTAMTKAFCAEIEKLGFTGGYYLNLDYSENYYNEKSLKKYKRWFAYYEDDMKPDCYLQQYTSRGSVKGISGDVDMDTLYGDYIEPVTGKEPEKTDSKPKTEKPVSKPEKPVSTPYYVVGEDYTVKVNTALNVRTGAGINNPLVGYNNLTPDGQRHAFKNGALKNGTKVTCLDVKEYSKTDIWIQIPSGWICAVSGDRRFVVK